MLKRQIARPGDNYASDNTFVQRISKILFNSLHYMLFNTSRWKNRQQLPQSPPLFFVTIKTGKYRILDALWNLSNTCGKDFHHIKRITIGQLEKLFAGEITFSRSELINKHS